MRGPAGAPWPPGGGRPLAAAGGLLVPSISAAEAAEMDRMMTEDYGITLLQMMESAGEALARVAARMAGRAAPGSAIVVLAGAGGNGGGALVAARRLAGWGHPVDVVQAAEDMGEEASVQLGILRRMGVPVRGGDLAAPRRELETVDRARLVIDGLIGYRLRGAPRAQSADLIRLLAQSRTPVLALDVPSGLEPTTGAVGELTVRADATLSLALPKAGVLAAPARGHVGRLHLADIGVPRQALSRLGLEVGDVFRGRPVVPLRRAHPEGAG